ncbi:beta/gamma crystallin domain-containing protein 1-like [Plectropomus leopardus]|uniref:beta/gamma crystallin domain-containing protein 1-like n=1 Tax=Plectropomus leopardus TaxID=160734 RepID=UPI001C4D2C94|nr:beta/gamma crystallin domain-containing protein 1-like [Plectropomus leopardus]
MSESKGLEIRIETKESFSTPTGPTNGSDGPLSPTYLSVGSDDGSAMEIYYSAEEDNTEESPHVEVYKVDERAKSPVVDVVKEAWLREDLPHQGEITESRIKKRDEGEFRVLIVKMQSEEGKMGNDEEKEDLNSRTEVQVRGQRSEDQVQEIKMSDFLVGNDAKTQEKDEAATVLPQVKEGKGEEERKEELPATPVQQVNTRMVCDLAPPSNEPHGQGEGSAGNGTTKLETEDPPNGEKQLASQEIQYMSHKDIMISEYMQAVSSNTGEEDVITPRFREADEQVSPTAAAQKIVEVSTETSSVTTASAVTDPSAGVEVVTGTLTHSAELQSNATQIEHNRAPQSSEWVDTITESTDRTRTVQEQVAVELSAQSIDTHLPDTKAAETLSERQEHPAEAQPDLTQGSLAESRTPTAASEVFASENKATAANKESVDEMSSSYSNLSTKLYMKTSSPPKENESKSRFRKVSLVNNTDTKEVVDTADISKTGTTVTESNGTDISSDFKWKNRFEAVAQYRPYKNDFSSFTDSLSYRVSDTDTSPPSSSSSSSYSFSSYSSAVPEATAYKHLSNAFSSSSSTSPPDEHITLGNQLSDSTKVYLSHESEPAGAPRDEWRRSLVEQEEPAAPAGEREKQRVAESERIKSRWESQELLVSSFSSSKQTTYDVVDSFKKEDDDDATLFTGVFKATLVELVSEPAAPPSTPPASPEADSPYQSDMDSLVDTLKSMGPSLRPRAGLGPRPPAPVLISSLPPIVEDAPSPITADIPGILSPTKKMEAISNPAESLKPLYTLPADIGLKKNNNRDNRSPLELMKHNQQDQQQPGKGGLNLPLRASTANSLVMRKSSDSSPEELKSPVLNGNGLLQSSITGSRLDNSVIFGNHRSASIDQPLENGKAHRSLFRTASLPETGLSNDRMSMGPKELSELGTKTDLAGSRFERLSFLLNSPPSSGSLPGSEDSNARMSRPPLMGIGSPPAINSPTRLLSPTGSIDLQRPFTTTDSPLSVFGQTQGLGMGVGTGVLSTPILQRSFSSEGAVGVQPTSLFNSLHRGLQSQEVETERNLATKYRAFPDAYLTKEKEHGKLNPRPGKMYIFDRPGMCGQRLEVRSDVIDATPWELQETISIRVIRGGWVLYEKPNFKGEKIALDEGDIEITYPFSPPEEQLQNGQQGKKQNGEQNGEEGDALTKTKPARRFIIGSLRRAVRDYSVPEIGLFPEENAEGKKVTFRDTSDDARIFGFPIKANSIIINAGLWLVYAHPFFQGVPRVLEVGGYSNPAAWGVEQPYVGSLHPLKIGEPRVENTSEPKMVIYDKPYFSGKSRTITTNMRDFMTRVDRQQTAFMYNVGSIKVLGGIWAGYEKEGFRGHQYLLEEGEYQDWRVWGGRDAELRSARVIRADLTDPVMVMFEQPEEDQEGMQEENTFEVTEAIPDVELFGYKTSTRSIHVLSGAWIAYSHVDFSGNQYILEKGFYNNCADWGSQDTRICSVQPILLAPGDSTRSRHEIILYSEPDFHGECHVFDRNQETTPEKLKTKSCRVAGGSWVIYEGEQYSGNLYVLSEGEYPNLTSMACPPDCIIRSVKVVPMKFSVPSISLFGLECLEGREITMDTEIPNMVEEGFNNHILSVRVNSGCWVICEHSNYRGRQFLLEPIEITNWLKFSSLQTIGSMFPVRQKRRYLRIKNTERGHFMSVQGGVEEMKSGRVVVTPEVEPMSDIWFYQDGLIKSKLAPNMSLQVMGNIEPGAKVVLWTETRQPIQTWAAQMRGLITSLTFPGCVLDVKGMKNCK